MESSFTDEESLCESSVLYSRNLRTPITLFRVLLPLGDDMCSMLDEFVFDELKQSFGIEDERRFSDPDVVLCTECHP
jgi:hypothetical protein